MKTNQAKIAITTIWATVAVVFLLLFSQQVTIDLNAPYIHLKLAGSNKSPSIAGVQGKNLDANENISAKNKIGDGVNIDNAKAGGSITLENGSSSREPRIPKP